MSIQSELKIYHKARRIADMIDESYSKNSLTEAKVSKISKLLGEVEFILIGERRSR